MAHVYVYAIRPAGLEAPESSGFAGSPVRVIGEGALEAVVSDVEARPPATEESLRTHDGVVDELMIERTVLPTRFGTALAEDDAVRLLLSERAQELEDALRRVDGAIELGVRVSWAAEDTAGPASEATTGTAYLTSLVDRERRAGDLAEHVDAPLRELARERHLRLLARPEMPLSASYLVDRERAAEFQARVNDLGRTLKDAEIVCTGPWAPYAFASPPAAAEAAT